MAAHVRKWQHIAWLCGLLWGMGAWAQATNTPRGQSLYTATCATCHGPDPNTNSTRGVANNPDALYIAMSAEPTMGFLRAALSAQDVIDVTGWIGVATGASGGFAPQNGWYWNPAESGRGYFFEKRGSSVFMAGFIYAADGRALWYTAQGTMGGNAFNSVMETFRNGQTLTGPYQAPVAGTALGNLSLNYTSASTARLTMAGHSTDLVRFPFASGSTLVPPQAGSPQSGWWWNPAEAGRGYALEIQGNQLFLIAFLYDDAGQPSWLLSNGVMENPRLYRNGWMRFGGGQVLGQPWRAPTLVDAQAGTLEIRFAEDGQNGELVLPDARVISITRFPF